MANPPSHHPQDPSFLDAILPIATLVGLIGSAVMLFWLAAIDGSVQVALILRIMD
jgi:NhaC family Na+:H+ antiporter